MLEQFHAWPPIYRDGAVLAAELLLVFLAFAALRLILGVLFRKLAAARAEKGRARLLTILRNVTALLVVIVVVVLLCLLAVNGYLLYRGAGVYAETIGWLERIPPGFWAAIAVGLAKTIGLVIVATIGIRILRRALLGLQERLKRADRLKGNDESIQTFFLGANRIQANAIWLLVLAFSAMWLQAPGLASYVFIALRVYLIISIGLLIVKALTAIVDTLDGLTARFASPDNILRFYHDLRTLVPLFRR